MSLTASAHSVPGTLRQEVLIDIRLTGDLNGSQLDRLEKIAAACPVRRAIESGIEFVERIELRPAGRLSRDSLAPAAGAA
ncbi:MAG: hypothetical protein ACXWYO_04220 [Gaiellaceae bacterium]